MKSEKAKEYIVENDYKLVIAKHVFMHCVDAIEKDKAIEAVELAEAEMRERATGAYKKVCKWYNNGICELRMRSECYDYCPNIIDFLNALDNLENNEL